MDAQKRVDESFRAKLQGELDTVVSSNTQLQHNLANAKDGNNSLLDRVSVLTSELKARGQEVH